MAFSPSLSDIGVVVVASAVFLWLRGKSKRSEYPLPPSPPGAVPILGHALLIPTKKEWETYERWGKELDTDIIYLNAAGTKLVIVNTVETIQELLDVRSARYSSRGTFTMINELMGWDWSMPTLPYNDQWRDQRKMFARYFSASNPNAYQPQILQVVRRFVHRVMETPDDFMKHSRNMVGGIAFSLAYGINADKPNDPNIALADAALNSVLEALLPGKYLVDLMPVLKYVPTWFPGAHFHQDALEGRKIMNRMRAEPYEQAQKALAQGSSLPSLMSMAFDDIRDGFYKNPEKAETTLKDLSATFYGAGSDTTTASIDNFIIAMILHPEIQRKAQQEMDTVVGRDRLPEFTDEAKMPYLAAVIKELVRWRPVSNIGLPHQCIEDDIYNGYFIPKGSLVIGNQRMMLHNPAVYPEPEKFIPERFLTGEEIFNPYEIAFGFGRRTCPGFHMALATTFLTAASLLSLFDLSKPVDEHGNVIEPSTEMTLGITAHPVPFKCSFQLRHPRAEELIRAGANFE
ncbi:cytochrome P450 [Coprinopsis marcescibilis]|uniref:Cytochrome P450 n=1 Tax=Coprinopsis marcescibilis TaxID=230819 RepID=A0A5C3L4H5_COPMA|nr:cytochrome P450 [Coprinopsis marcescibilis]